MSTTVRVIKLEDNFKRAIEAASGEQLLAACRAGGLVIETHAKLNIRERNLIDTGNLVNSIRTQTTKTTKTSAEVEVGTGVEYARIHEFGGMIHPLHARFLHFWVNGVEVFTKLVTIPARPYLRPAVDENMDAIKAAIIHQLTRGMGL